MSITISKVCRNSAPVAHSVEEPPSNSIVYTSKLSLIHVSISGGHAYVCHIDVLYSNPVYSMSDGWKLACLFLLSAFMTGNRSQIKIKTTVAVILAGIVLNTG